MFSKRINNCVLTVIVVILAACEENTSDITFSQFEGPQDVALVCYDEAKRQTLPLDCCGNDGKCSFGISTAKLFAFVTQTTPGEVAVVDVEEQSIVDQAKQVPYNSFIPVGGQPNDIAATTDGSRVFTANYETGDVSVIRVIGKEKKYSVIDSPFLSPANSIDLHGPAARIALVKHPERYADKVALVTQPEQGRVTVLALDPEDCPEPDTQVDGCVKGYLSLNVNIPGEDEPVEMHPAAISSADGQSVYIGSYDTPVIVDVQLESLVVEALAMETPGEIDPEKVVNEVIDIHPYTLRSMSIEPQKRRWLYGIDHIQGIVVAFDLGGRVPGSGKSISTTEVKVDGLPRAVKILELSEDADPGPFTFNGTFGVITTTLAGIAVVDIEDNDSEIQYFHPHKIRSNVDLSDEEYGVPKLDKAPELTVDKKRIEERRTEEYVRFTEEADGGVECDAGAGFKPTYDEGIRFRCDPYESRRETWTLTWEGPIGLSGTGVVVNINDKGAETYQMVNEDSAKDFCHSELFTENSVEGYAGDLLVITSKPTPVKGAEDLCKDKYHGELDRLVYRVVGISRYREDDADLPDEEKSKPDLIEFEKLENSLDLLPKCFGQALEFQIQASEHWTIKGSRSSFIRNGKMKGKYSPEVKACTYTADEKSMIRVYPGESYRNQLIQFDMEYGDAWRDGPTKIDPNAKDTDTSIVSAVVKFNVVDGYEEMYRVVGATNITDIEQSPKGELMMVDQGGEGLIVFDLLGSFNTVGSHIN